MITTKDHSLSLWQDFDAQSFDSLDADLRADACIIGGGISGLTTAYYLAKAGVKVVVIDDGCIGGRQTLRTTAHLSNAFDARYFRTQNLFGHDAARLIAESHSWAIQEIKAISDRENISCEYQGLDGYLFLDPEHKIDFLAREHRASVESGLHDVEFLSKFPYDGEEPAFELGACLRYPSQAKIHPTKYVIGLARAIQKLGGLICQQTRAVEIKGGDAPFVKTKNGHRIDANFLIVATNVPVNTMIKFHIKQAAYRSYVIACAMPREYFPDVLLWDTGSPYHYVRTADIEDKEYLIVGGEDHKVGQMHQGLHPHLKLYRWAQEKFPFIQKVMYSWSGQIIESNDGLAYIGALDPANKNVFVATADSGQGMTHGTIAGRLISDLIGGRANPWTELYNPSRVTLKAAPTFIKENVNTAVQYRDWLAIPTSCSGTELPKKGGRICREGLRKIAMYRDEKGTVHELSPICPHMGGLVRWNDCEKTWDCPCHGSRFSAEGKVINGPATSDLKEITPGGVPAAVEDPFHERRHPDVSATQFTDERYGVDEGNPNHADPTPPKKEDEKKPKPPRPAVSP